MRRLLIYIGKLEKRFINNKNKMDGENLLYKYCQKNYRKNFREQKVIQPLICGECVIFT